MTNSSGKNLNRSAGQKGERRESASNKYPEYPEYKDSGVEWLENVPSHWETKQLKFLCSYNDEVIGENLDPDSEIEYVDIGSVSATEGILKTELMKFGAAPSRARRIVRDGDVIVSTVRTYLEAIASIDRPSDNLIVSTGFAVIRPNKLLQKRYAAYCMRTQGFIREVISRSVGVSYPAINATDLVNIKTPKPLFEEQEVIANFLDHETAKIDTLIEQQQQLIQLLKEKRQAVISHAVTKGLNPDAPMRDSGVEWLGEVPAHWDVCRLGDYALKIGSGKTPKGGSEIYQDEGILFLRSQNIYNDGLHIEQTESVYIDEKTDAEMSSTRVQPGDILLNITGGSIGRTCIVPDNFQHANVNQHVCIIRMPKKLGLFFSFFVKSTCLREQIDFLQNGGNREGLNFEQIRKFSVALPPQDELVDICEYIQQQINKIEDMIIKSEQAIQLMQERRTALISAAVTGKIDVRHFVSKDGQAPQQ